MYTELYTILWEAICIHEVITCICERHNIVDKCIRYHVQYITCACEVITHACERYHMHM